jgi:ribosome-associated protein
LRRSLATSLSLRPSAAAEVLVNTAAITAHLVANGSWTYSRSGGPGGQRRDHVATEARFELTSAALAGLPNHVTTRLRSGLHLDERPLRLRSGTERLRAHNRERIIARLARRVDEAMGPPPPPRRPTRPSRGAVERRLADKRRRASTKSRRSSPEPE